jgi:uncharacterized protein (TIGR02996 family)
MTEEENLLLQAVLNDPNNDAPRLKYAHGCELQFEEVMKARAQFIRTQVSLVNNVNAMSYEDWFDASHIDENLRTTYGKDWVGKLDTLIDEYTFDRGFVACVAMPAVNFLHSANQIYSLTPIQHLKLTEVLPYIDELFASPYLNNVISLDIDRCDLGDNHIKTLAESPVLQNLKWLSIAENNLKLEGADTLAASALSEQLVYVNLYGNPEDPSGQYSTDNDLIMDSWLPESGKQLEAKYGHLQWLRRDAETIDDVVPNRFRLA